LVFSFWLVARCWWFDYDLRVGIFDGLTPSPSLKNQRGVSCPEIGLHKT
jgi:hypothetical protein